MVLCHCVDWNCCLISLRFKPRASGRPCRAGLQATQALSVCLPRPHLWRTVLPGAGLRVGAFPSVGSECLTAPAPWFLMRSRRSPQDGPSVWCVTVTALSFHGVCVGGWVSLSLPHLECDELLGCRDECFHSDWEGFDTISSDILPARFHFFPLSETCLRGQVCVSGLWELSETLPVFFFLSALFIRMGHFSRYTSEFTEMN